MPKKIVDTILPTTMVGSYPRPHWFHQQLLGRDVRVAFKEVDARGGLQRRDARRDPRPGGSRPRHRHRRPDVLRRLRRRDRLVLLVHVRADRRLRPGARGAPLDHRGRASTDAATALLTTGAASSTAAPRRTGRSASSTSTRSPSSTRTSRSRSRSAPGRSTSPGTSTSSTTRTRRSSATRSRRSSTPR